MRPVRVLDSGLNSARWNVATSAALLELHRAGRIPDSVRFHRYPRSVLIGRHQDLEKCAADPMDASMDASLELARRISGGGAVYMSPQILAWDIVINRAALADGLAGASERFGTAVASGLSRLGVSAQYCLPNDVIVNGRKVSGSSGSFEGATLMHQGTVLICFDMAEMADALVGKEDMAGRNALRTRVISLAEALGRMPVLDDVRDALIGAFSDALDRPLVWGVPGREELDLAERLLTDEFGTDEFVCGPRALSANIRGRKPAAMAGVS